MTTLNISDTFKTAWHIYRARFGEYYRIALANSFWIFVPVYGWAKYAAMMGLLARLAYGDVTGNKETIAEAKRYIKPKTWFFFGAGLMGSLILFLWVLLFSIPLLIVNSIVLSQSPSLIFSKPFLLLTSLINLVFGYYFYKLMSRLFLYELPLAIEQDTNATESRDITWKLVTGSIFKLQIIICLFSIFFVFTYFIVQKINGVISSGINFESILNLLDFSTLNFFNVFSETISFFGVVFVPALSSAIGMLLAAINPFVNSFFSSEVNVILFLLDTIRMELVYIAYGALFIPFWQSLKAVVYYRLNRTSS